MIFETHAHYDDEAFDEDREALLASLSDKGVRRVINVGASIESTRTTLALAETHENVYAAVGVHPSDIEGLNEETYAWLREQAKNPKTVAIGEIGLDYYWDKEADVQERQRDWFKRQLDLAVESQLPVIIHSRDAAEDTLRILKEHGTWQIAGHGADTVQQEGQQVCGVIHCYSYSPEMAREFVKMGYYIGVGGVVTFKNAKKLKETVQEIPLERILLETDCPYMAPEPNRGKRNYSGYIPYVVEKIAELKGISAEEVERITWDNAMRLFTKVQP
jgi:TatD DNase family protein